jgi:hypothetical protein
MIKYLVFPDFVYSKNDGDKHFISGKSLISLYGVSRDECVIVTHESQLKNLKGTFTVLKPNYLGDYSLDKCKKIHLFNEVL